MDVWNCQPGGPPGRPELVLGLVPNMWYQVFLAEETNQKLFLEYVYLYIRGLLIKRSIGK